jgi:Alpha amylase, catalytic domain
MPPTVGDKLNLPCGLARLRLRLVLILWLLPVAWWKKDTKSIRGALRTPRVTVLRTSTASGELGVDAIWITAFFPSSQVDFGYDVSDYENVDPQFGIAQCALIGSNSAHSFGKCARIESRSMCSSLFPWALHAPNFA